MEILIHTKKKKGGGTEKEFRPKSFWLQSTRYHLLFHLSPQILPKSQDDACSSLFVKARKVPVEVT